MVVHQKKVKTDTLKKVENWLVKFIFIKIKNKKMDL